MAVPAPGGELAGVVYRAEGSASDAFWMLHLHGNADSAFSPWQVRHCEALRRSGFNVLEIDYRGFGPTPGRPSEAGMYDDSEAAYRELLRRGVLDFFAGDFFATVDFFEVDFLETAFFIAISF